MNQIIFREANNEDIPYIHQFQMEMAMESEGLKLNSDICHKGITAVFENPIHGKYFVGEANGLPIASLLITFEWSDWRNGQVWWIQSVFVKPEHRGKKVFSKFYSYIQKLTEKNQNIRGLRLYVDQNNKHAQKVYETLGMNGDHYKVFEWMKK